MATTNSDFVVGVVCRDHLSEDPGVIHMTPGGWGKSYQMGGASSSYALHTLDVMPRPHLPPPLSPCRCEDVFGWGCPGPAVSHS
jgi:hypothetical protein